MYNTDHVMDPFPISNTWNFQKKDKYLPLVAFFKLRTCLNILIWFGSRKANPF